MNASHFYYLHQFFLINSKIFEEYKFDGIWVNPVVQKSRGIFGYLYYKLRYFFSYLLYLKWSKLYKTIGIEKTYNISSFDISYQQKKKSILKSKLFLNTKIKKKFMINNLRCGDLISDTYLRFFEEVQIRKNNKSQYHIEQIFKYVYRFDNFFKKKLRNYDLLLPIQASFITNGYIVRYFLNKKKNVIGGWNFSQYIKKYTKTDYLHHCKWENYQNIFSKLKEKGKKLKLAHKYMKKRFSGEVDQTNYYMKKGTYTKFDRKDQKYLLQQYKKIDCIIFLPCFVDSPFAFGDIVFNDGYNWIIETLEFFKKKKLIVIIKEHPNSLSPSINFVKTLRSKYAKDFIWIDKETPNNHLFNLKPKVCISLTGNILIEVAYHNIIPISAGRNPFCNYDFVITPKTKIEYFKKIELGLKNKLLINKKKRKNKILECFYMHYLNNNDFGNYENYSRKFNINNFMRKFLSNSKLFKELNSEISAVMKINIKNYYNG